MIGWLWNFYHRPANPPHIVTGEQGNSTFEECAQVFENNEWRETDLESAWKNRKWRYNGYRQINNDLIHYFTA